MRILALNQYGERDRSPTARLLRELAGALRAAGHEVAVISVGRDYGQGAQAGVCRWKRELGALLHLRREGCRAASPDLVLSFSSPPLLATVGHRVASHHRVPHVHWALDLYPDLAAALGANPSRLVDRVSRFLMRRAYQGCREVVTLDEDMAATLRQGYHCEPLLLPPWPPVPSAQDVAHGLEPVGGGAEAPTGVWLYSGNLGRAHAWEPLVAIQAELEKRGSQGRLVIQGDGYSVPPLREEVERRRLQAVEFRDYAPEDRLLTSLLAARVLVVTMKPQVRGLLWPSKLALAGLTGVPVLLLGPTDSTPARQVRAGGGAAFAPEDVASAADWLEAELATPRSPPPPGEIAERAGQARERALAQWRELLQPGIVSPDSKR